MAHTTDPQPTTPDPRDTHDDRHPRTCPLAWLGVTAMGVVLVVTSILTTAAGAQLPSTSPEPGGESAGAGGTAGQLVFAVVVTLILGTTVVLFLRHRGNQRR